MFRANIICCIRLPPVLMYWLTIWQFVRLRRLVSFLNPEIPPGLRERPADLKLSYSFLGRSG